MCWCLSQRDGTSAWTHRFQPIVFFVAPVNESNCKDSWDRKGRLNALKRNKIMTANESYSFLARDLQRWYLDLGLRRPAVFITESHTKHGRNVKQDVCIITSYRNAFYFYPLLDGLGTTTRNFKDNSLQPMLHFEIPAYYSQPLIRTAGQYWKSISFYLERRISLIWFGFSFFEWAQNI